MILDLTSLPAADQGSGFIEPGQPAPFRAGSINRLNSHWMPAPMSGDEAILQSALVMNPRIRDQIRNDQVLSKIVEMHTALGIGQGILSWSDATEDSSGTYFEAFGTEADDWFDDWATEEADMSGRNTLYDMQRLSYKEMISVGMSIWLEVINPDGNRGCPLCYQLIEAEQLDCNRDRPAMPGSSGVRRRNRIVNGMELDRYNRLVGAWIYDAHPHDYAAGGYTDRSTFVPARRLIMNFRQDRISSHVGRGWFACLVQASKDRDALVANEVTSRKLSALMTFVTKRATPASTIADYMSGMESGEKASRASMGHPAFLELQHGDEAEVIKGGDGGEDFAAVLSALIGTEAMGATMSKFRVTGDAGKDGNMASITAGHLDDELVVGPIQHHQENKIVRPIRLRHQDLMAALGNYRSVTSREYARNRRKLKKLLIVASARPDVQPKNDGEAAIDRMRSGRTTYQYECGRLGFYWRSNLRMQKQFQDELKRLGLGSPDWGKGGGGLLIPFVKSEDQPFAKQATDNRVKGAAE